MVTLAQIGLVISLGFPSVISIYKETRFVINKNLLTYGISLITFTLSYTAHQLKQEYVYLKPLSWLFFVIGLLMIYFFMYPNKNPIKMENNPVSLIYSWKNFGAFEFAFITPLFFQEIPEFIVLTGNSILDLGLSLLVIFWIASFGFFIYRNWVKD